MSAIPGEPLKQKPNELTLKDGRKLKLKVPGLSLIHISEPTRPY